MPKRLSQAEVTKRMVRLRNLEKLPRMGRHRRDLQQEIIAKLEALVANQQALLEQQDAMLNTQAIRIAELETMVFGKKKQPPMGGTPIPAGEQSLSAAPKQPRSKDSYRRPIPPSVAITAEVAVPLPDHCACGGSFDPNATTMHDRYEEDIPLPELTPDYRPHLVTQYVVARGICLACGKATSGKDLGGAQVALGSNVRLLVVHLIVGMGMSYAQAATLFLSLYGIRITDGEIAAMLQKQHQQWLPAYRGLKADIRAAPVVHGDETPWPIQDLQGLGYAWNMCDAASPKVCFAFEQSRGAVHAQTLFGQDTAEPFAGVRITDDYGAYHNADLPGQQPDPRALQT